MQTSRIRFAAANAVVIAILMGSPGPALPQDLQSLESWADAYSKNVDERVAQYLQKHPVRRSLLFDSVSSMLETLGQTKARAIDECEYEPEFGDWEAVVPRLRENTTIALNASFSKGNRIDRSPPPTGQMFVGRFFCDELMLQYDRILRDLHGVGLALVKQGY